MKFWGFFVSLHRQKFAFDYPGRIPRGVRLYRYCPFKVTFLLRQASLQAERGWLFYFPTSPYLIGGDLKMLKEGFELILGGEAGVSEETINVTPFVETAIIEEFKVVGNDEGYNMIS